MLGASLTMGATGAKGQDPGAAAAQAAQQASMQAAIQANQQAIQMQQQAIQLAVQQANQQATQNALNATQNSSLCCVGTAVPTFSVKPGTYSRTLQVKIRDNTRGATIYYTTDGWTPTTASAKYTGPIEIDATTQLQAIAVGPAPLSARSLVAKAQYTLTVSGVPAAIPAQTAAGLAQGLNVSAPLTQDGSMAMKTPGATQTSGSAMLAKGTAVRLEFVTSVNSKTADVGDKVALKLADDIKDGNTVLVAKGAKAEATITEADRTGIGGAPGNIVFRVDSMNVDGKAIPLNGTAALEGDPRRPNGAILIPVVGVFTVFRHGTNAEIKAGTPVTAYVAADTSLLP
jgi:hypothetical protein